MATSYTSLPISTWLMSPGSCTQREIIESVPLSVNSKMRSISCSEWLPVSVMM